MARAAFGNLLWRPLRDPNRRFGSLVVFTWLATTVALVAVLLLAAIDTVTSQWFGTADAVSPNPEIVMVADPDLGNSVTYGAVQWRLLQTRLVPRSYDDPFSRPVVIIETTATNLSPDVAVRAHSRDLTLVLESGERVPIQRFEHTPSTERIVLEPGQSMPVTLVFKPVLRHDPYLPHLVLEIQEPNRYPAHLPLDGSTASELYPRDLHIAAAADQAITITEARLDVNAAAYRARVDERLVVLRVAVDGAALADDERSPAATASPIWPANEYWRLNVTTYDADDTTGDAEPQWQAIGPTRMTVVNKAQQANPDEHFAADEADVTVLEFVFLIPADATSNPMALTAGHADAEVGVIGTDPIRSARLIPGWRWQQGA